MGLYLTDRYLRPGDLAEKTLFSPFLPKHSIPSELFSSADKPAQELIPLDKKITLLHKVMDLNKAELKKHWAREQKKQEVAIKQEIGLRLGQIVGLLWLLRKSSEENVVTNHSDL